MLAECMYDYRGIETMIKKVDNCSNCDDPIYEHQVYYDIDGKILCKDCVEDCKIEGE